MFPPGEPMGAWFEVAQGDWAVVDGPDVGVHLLQADGFTGQGFAYVPEPVAPADLPGGGDGSEFEVAGVVHGCQVLGIRPWGGCIQFGGRDLPQGLVRSIAVVAVDEGIEGSLLGRQVSFGGSGGFFLEGSVHSFVPGVVGGCSQADTLHSYAQPQPPHRESTQAPGTA